MSLTVNHVMPIWADNRIDPGAGGPDRDVYAADLDNLNSGCDGSDLAVNAGDDATLCMGETIQLTAGPSGGNGPYSYAWTPTTGLDNPTSATPMATVNATITYTVRVTDQSACFAEDSLTLGNRPDFTEHLPQWTGTNGSFDHDGNGRVNLIDLILGLCPSNPRPR